MIHPTAVIHPKAKLDATVQIGPYAIIDDGVELGAGCKVGPNVYLTGATRIGSGNQFFAGCVIGEAPQDLKYRGERTALRIGENNVFREHVTVHRSNKPGTETIIGSNNFLMQHSHVAHNVELKDYVILAGGALLAGHVLVEDRAFISGNCVVHQFTRIGTLAMMRGGSAISKDLPPYTVARGENALCGLNTVGLRRAEISAEDRLELKKLYHTLFRNKVSFAEAVQKARESFRSEPARRMLDFLGKSTRGICGERNRGQENDDLEANLEADSL